MKTVPRPALAGVALMVLLAGCTVAPSFTQLTDWGDDRGLAALGLTDTVLAYQLLDLESGDVLAERTPDRPMPPASTAKLPTMIAALDILGPHHRFETTVRATGQLHAGVLKGDIWLTGNGDPLFRMGDLKALAVRLKDIGITRVSGRFHFASKLPPFAEVTGTQPAWAAYNQGLSGLNLEYNRVYLTAGDAPQTVPREASGLGPLAPDARAGRDIPVRDPGLFAARMFRRFTAGEGIALSEPTAGSPPKNAAIIARVESAPLFEIARAGLEYSNNMVAEVVGLAAARYLNAGVTTLADAAAVLTSWLDTAMAGPVRYTPKLLNNSGLHAGSRISAAQMTALLRHADGIRFGGWRPDTLLTPGGGREGFRGRFKRPETAFRIWAKTGTMRYIKGLAGYIETKGGRRAAFAVFLNDPNARRALEINPQRYSTEAGARSSDWRNRTDLFEEALITRWINAY